MWMAMRFCGARHFAYLFHDSGQHQGLHLQNLRFSDLRPSCSRYLLVGTSKHLAKPIMLDTSLSWKVGGRHELALTVKTLEEMPKMPQASEDVTKTNAEA
jgi:hypothetical protein